MLSKRFLAARDTHGLALAAMDAGYVPPISGIAALGCERELRKTHRRLVLFCPYRTRYSSVSPSLSLSLLFRVGFLHHRHTMTRLPSFPTPSELSRKMVRSRQNK